MTTNSNLSILKTTPFELLLLKTNQDIWMNHIMTRLNVECCSELLFVSKSLHQTAITHLQKISPPMAHPCRFIDTGSGDRPFINKWKVLKWLNELGPLVEGNAGCSVLIMREGFALKKQVEQARESGITVDVYWSKIFEELDDDPAQQTSVIFITNNVLIGSRNKSHRKQREQLKDLGCKLPKVQEYVALCVRTQSLFQTCLYGGQNPLTFGSASTHYQGYPLAVGNSTPTYLTVCTSESASNNLGAAGKRTF
jgi:hypothetical protein